MSSRFTRARPRAPARALRLSVIALALICAPLPAAADFRDARLQFDGTDDVVVVPSSPSISLETAVTVEAWIQPATIAATKEQDRIVSKTSSYELTISTGDTGCWFGTRGHIQWRATIAGVDARVCGGAISPGTWAHVAGTYGNGVFALYVNGAAVATASRAGLLAVDQTPLTIGNRPQLDRGFDGGIDAVRVWNRALSQAELEANMNAELGGSSANLAAEYRFMEGSGQVVADASTQANDGVRGLTSAEESSDPGWIGAPGNQAPSVDAGRDHIITLPTNTAVLDGRVSDDGLPASTLTVQWSQVSGPATVTFDNAHSEDTGATFPVAGSYVLQLEASDGALANRDSVSVEVRHAAGTTVSIEIQPDEVTLNPSQSQQFTAIARDAAGNPIATTPSWSASSGLISATGHYTAPAASGRYTVHASLGGISDAATVEIVADSATFPGNEWPTATPAEVGMNVTLLDEGRDYALRGGGAGFVVRHGKRIYSWGNTTARYELKGATRSVGSVILGLGIRDGLVRLDDAASLHIPSFGTPPAANAATGWLANISLLQLATSSAGFEKTGAFGALMHAPGTMWRYSDGSANWLGDVLTRAYGEDLDTLLLDRLMAPLGIPRNRLTWRTNAYRSDTLDGIRRRELASGMSSDVETLARIGYLFLRRGVWSGTRIIDEDFVDRVRQPVASVRGLPVHEPAIWQGASDRYGILWWSNHDGALRDVPPDAYYAHGLGEALIVVIPSLDLVVTRLGNAWWSGTGPSPDVLAPFLGPIARSVEGQPPPPVNAAPIIRGMPPTSVMSGSPYLFQPTAADADGDPLTFAIQNAPPWASFDPASGALSGLPSLTHVGSYPSITISVSDGQESAALPPFAIEVQAPPPTNRPPSISGEPPRVVQSGSAYLFQPTASDADGDPLTFSIENAPPWASFDPSSGALSGTPALTHVGSYPSITISVSDEQESVALPAFAIEVQAPPPTNRPPTIAGEPPAVIQSGSAYLFQPTASDADDDPLTFLIQNAPPWASFDPSSGVLSGTPTLTHVGSYPSITISVSDGQESAALPAFAIEVQAPPPTNRPPTIAGEPPAVVQSGNSYLFQPTASDADGDPLTFSIQNAPLWASFDPSSGALSGTPSLTHVGSYPAITISVSDGQESAALLPFTITVTGLGQATLTWVPPVTNVDGTPIATLAGYRIQYGRSPTELTQTIQVVDPGLTSYVVTDLVSGTWYFGVKVYTVAGLESALSNIASKTIN